MRVSGLPVKRGHCRPRARYSPRVVKMLDIPPSGNRGGGGNEARFQSTLAKWNTAREFNSPVLSAHSSGFIFWQDYPLRRTRECLEDDVVDTKEMVPEVTDDLCSTKSVCNMLDKRLRTFHLLMEPFYLRKQYENCIFTWSLQNWIHFTLILMSK